MTAMPGDQACNSNLSRLTRRPMAEGSDGVHGRAVVERGKANPLPNSHLVWGNSTPQPAKIDLSPF